MSGDLHAEAHHSGQKHLYELVVGLAVIYGFLVFFIWQQTERRMIVLKQEVAMLQSELASAQSESNGETPDGAAVDELASSPTRPFQFETEHLHFEFSQRTVELMQSTYQLFENDEQTGSERPGTQLLESVATASEMRYRLLHRDLGLALPSTHEKVQIFVDRATNRDYSFGNEDTLVIPFPKNIAEHLGLPETKVLTNEILARLTSHTLDKALKGREIQPQWRTMVYVLHYYPQLEYGHLRHWQLDPVYLARRHAAQMRALADALQRPDSPSGREVADPLIEYLLETYGYAIVPELLDAFEEHESWATLAPSVFDISARELEENWHAYLTQKYPPA
ncbi:MAG: hypothetical protein R3C14_15300 [Caldilineaceae bacterium]